MTKLEPLVSQLRWPIEINSIGDAFLKALREYLHIKTGFKDPVVRLDTVFVGCFTTKVGGKYSDDKNRDAAEAGREEENIE